MLLFHADTDMMNTVVLLYFTYTCTMKRTFAQEFDVCLKQINNLVTLRVDKMLNEIKNTIAVCTSCHVEIACTYLHVAIITRGNNNNNYNYSLVLEVHKEMDMNPTVIYPFYMRAHDTISVHSHLYTPLTLVHICSLN